MDPFFEETMELPDFDDYEEVDGEFRFYYRTSDAIERVKSSISLMVETGERFESGKAEDGTRKPTSLEDLTRLLHPRSCVVWKDEIAVVNGQVYSRIFVIGDLHGSKAALEDLFERNRILEHLARPKTGDEETLVIFLGDYIDRGEKSWWVLYHVMKLKLLFPDNVLLLRGNHEFYPCGETGEFQVIVSPADFLEFLSHSYAINPEGSPYPLFDESFRRLLFCRCFNRFLTGVFIDYGDKKIFVSHSGFPRPSAEVDFNLLLENEFDFSRVKVDRFPDLRSVEDLTREEVRLSLVWSEVVDEKYRSGGGRQLRKEIGRYAQVNFMEKFGIDAVIRGHDHPREGVRVMEPAGDGRKIYTLLSCGGYGDVGCFSKNYLSGFVLIRKDGSIEPLLMDREEVENGSDRLEEKTDESEGEV